MDFSPIVQGMVREEGGRGGESIGMRIGGGRGRGTNIQALAWAFIEKLACGEEGRRFFGKLSFTSQSRNDEH